VEAALLLPWMFFMFVGILDLGFYYYAMIATQNAARVAALQVSGSSCSVAATCATVACPLALAEMQTLPNVNGLTTCTTGTTVTNSAPVAVVVTGNVLTPPCAAASANCIYSVTVTYLTIPMIPMPGLLPGRLTIPATVQMQTD
jgi:Flp pilus assembly protein TadG